MAELAPELLSVLPLPALRTVPGSPNEGDSQLALSARAAPAKASNTGADGGVTGGGGGGGVASLPSLLKRAIDGTPSSLRTKSM